MQKLMLVLLVLAIQFFLPWTTERMVQKIPEFLSVAQPFEIELKTLLIQTIGAACIVGLLWPRWIMMLLGSGLLIFYLFYWQELYQRKYVYYDHPEVPIHFSTKFYLLTAALIFVVNLCLSRQVQVCLAPPAASPADEPRDWQFGLHDLLLGTALLALLAAALPYLKKTQLLSYYELIQIFSTTAIVYDLLWLHWSWRRVSILLLCLAAVLWFSYPDLSRFGIGVKGQLMFVTEFIVIAVFSTILYRWAGFRIVPHRDLALNTQTSNT